MSVSFFSCHLEIIKLEVCSSIKFLRMKKPDKKKYFKIRCMLTKD